MSQVGATLEAIPLATHEALSGVLGSISLASWIFLLLPQLVENYRLKTAEGVSLSFLCIWLIGDATNLAGALWAQLVPTVIALAVYFCFSDVALILQCTYYNWRNARRNSGRERESYDSAFGPGAVRRPRHGSSTAIMEEEDDNDEEPLLSRRESHPQRSNSGPSAAALRRRSSTYSARGRSDSLTKILEEPTSDTDSNSTRSKLRSAMKNTICILLVCGVGTAGWAVAWKTGLWRPVPVPVPDKAGTVQVLAKKKETPLGAEILGYISAAAYLGARLPQIWKNWKEKSCEGLSLLFFMLSLMGNLTYGASILCHSLEKQYVITNVPWLIGSLGTMIEDVTIFVQFHIYGDNRKDVLEGRDGEYVSANGNGVAYGATDAR